MHDVVVYGSTPAGSLAAIAAAGEVCTAAIVTSDHHVGGLQTSGLGFTNAAQRETVGGLMREFHERIRAYYTSKYGAGSEQAEACGEGFFFEPHVAERIYTEWLGEAGVDVVTGVEVVGVERDGSRIQALTTADNQRFAGGVFVDASYEGDLLAWAGCSYRVGREGSDEYGESLAGVRYPPEEEGGADGKTQGYDFRLCLTTDTRNQLPFREPPTYDPALYAFRRAQLREGEPEPVNLAETRSCANY